MREKRKIKNVVVLVMMFGLFGCAGVNFVQLNQEAKNFHPKSIAILPVTVGEHESARDVVDSVVSKNLLKKGWYENVIDASTIKTQTAGSAEIAGDLSTYIQRLNTLGVSDPVLALKLGQMFKADALFLTYVSSWGYGRMEGNKIARVGLGGKLVDVSTGTLMWKANHELVEDYWVFKPELQGMADELLDLLLEELPR